MKKWGILISALLLGALLYYFAAGRSRMIEEMRTEVNATLTAMAQQGFGVEQSVVDNSDERIILRFDDPEKIAHFFQSRQIALTPEDAALLKGFEVAIDLHYLPDSSHAVTADIYPLRLPQSLLEAKSDPKNRQSITHLEAMLKRQAILLHMALNNAGSHFEGRMKDINETFSSPKRVTVTMQGFAFDGDIDQNTPQTIAQRLQRMTLSNSEGVKIEIAGAHTRYRRTAQSLYAYAVDYDIEKMMLQAQQLMVNIEDIRARSRAQSQNGLLNEEINTTAKALSLISQNPPITLKDIHLEMRADNLDIRALELLQKRSEINREKIDQALRELLSKGVLFEITNFSVSHIIQEQQTLQGFSAKAKFKTDKNFDPALLQRSPLAALDKIEATAEIALSNDLYATLAVKPQVMMMLMFLPPFEKNGKKHFSFTLQHGALSLNGRRIR